MQEYEFTDKELAYIKQDIFEKSQDIHIDGLSYIKAHLPKGKYYILVLDEDDRLDLVYDLNKCYKIPATAQTTREDLQFLRQFCISCGSLGVTFTIPSEMDIEFPLFHEQPEHFANIIYTLRKQAIYNRNLKKEVDLLNL